MTHFVWRLNVWMSRVMPDAFSLAVILTLGIMAMAKWLTPAGWVDILDGWGGEFWSLLSFAMQMCLVMMTGFIASESPLVRKALSAFASLAQDGRTACVLMAFSSMVLAWVHWGLCIAGSAVLLRYFAIRQPKIHYPLLVACAYFGMGAIWHAGFSGSAPLLVATPGHFLEKNLGVIPLSQTVFAPWNLAMAACAVGLLTGLAWFLYPAKGEGVAVCPEATLDRFHEELVDREEKGKENKERGKGAGVSFSLAEKIERSYAVNLVLSALGAAYLGSLILRGKWNFDINLFNFVFLTLAVGLHPSVKSLMEAAKNGAHTIVGILIQFPLYAGMYGVIKSTGLSDVLGKAFTTVAGPTTFPFAVYLYSGILNYFVPSGGSKWAIEAPYLIETAHHLGVASPKLILSYAWGDMVTDLIQPFFCLPLLAAAQMEFRQIMGYLTIAFIVAAAIGSVGVLVLGVM